MHYRPTRADHSLPHLDALGRGLAGTQHPATFAAPRQMPQVIVYRTLTAPHSLPHATREHSPAAIAQYTPQVTASSSMRTQPERVEDAKRSRGRLRLTDAEKSLQARVTKFEKTIATRTRELDKLERTVTRTRNQMLDIAREEKELMEKNELLRVDAMRFKLTTKGGKEFVTNARGNRQAAEMALSTTRVTERAALEA